MSSITILPGRRKGRVSVPLSKSHLHRLMIADYLSGGNMYKHRYEACEDVSATQRCLEALGSSGRPVLDCGESGSTLRFMLPLASALSGHAVFLAGGRLPQRPIQPFLDLLRANGVNAEAAFPLRQCSVF